MEPVENYPPTTLIVGPSLELLSAARILCCRGEQVALLSRSDVRLEQLRAQFVGEGLSCAAFRADVTEPGDTLTAFASLAKWSPRLDRLIYNRRVVSSEQAAQVPESEMNRVMGANLFGFVNCFQLAHPMFKRCGSGAAIVVSDDRLRGPDETGVAYEASHAASQIYLAALRREVAPDHVHICELLIGIIREHDVLRNPNDEEVVNAVCHVIDRQPDRFSIGEPNNSGTGRF
jgi:short-subunit dehydrogenase